MLPEVSKSCLSGVLSGEVGTHLTSFLGVKCIHDVQVEVTLEPEHIIVPSMQHLAHFQSVSRPCLSPQEWDASGVAPTTEIMYCT